MGFEVTLFWNSEGRQRSVESANEARRDLRVKKPASWALAVEANGEESGQPLSTERISGATDCMPAQRSSGDYIRYKIGPNRAARRKTPSMLKADSVKNVNFSYVTAQAE